LIKIAMNSFDYYDRSMFRHFWEG